MKTKQNMAVLVVFAMTLGLIAPALVSAPASAVTMNVGTGVEVPVGGGEIPEIIAKWEQDYSNVLEDADPSHTNPGSQFLPTCQYNISENIKYCVVVMDEEDNGNVQQAWVDVFHPRASWERGSFKYEVPLVKLDTTQLISQATKDLFTAADAAHIVSYNLKNHTEVRYDVNSTLFELNKGTAKVWCGDGDLYYEQPAGIYTVTAGALDFNSNPSSQFNNTFEYVATTCFAVDNTAINYGSVRIGNMKVVAGDTIFLQNDGMMTIRNLGNTYLQATVVQDDMGFGQDYTGMWNVEYDGRIGHVVNSTVYQPYGAPAGTPTSPVYTTLPGLLPHSTDDELDFSIHLKKAIATGNYGGTMTLSSVIVNWCTVPGSNC